MKARFVIDGREYSDPQDFEDDTFEALDALDDRHLPGETMTVRARPSETFGLPTWSQFKNTLAPLDSE